MQYVLLQRMTMAASPSAPNSDFKLIYSSAGPLCLCQLMQAKLSCICYLAYWLLPGGCCQVTSGLYTLCNVRHAHMQAMQGKEGGTLVLRYTLQQQFHQDVKSLHTDAWLEHTSTAGQRALQVGEDPKWVIIASSGLQRAAANVGAGGMIKKNLPVSVVDKLVLES